MNKKHSQTPWFAELNAPGAVLIPGHLIKVDDRDGDNVMFPIAVVWEGGGTKGKPLQIANTEFIVHACNNHYDQQEALATAAAKLIEAGERLANIHTLLSRELLEAGAAAQAATDQAAS